MRSFWTKSASLSPRGNGTNFLWGHASSSVSDSIDCVTLQRLTVLPGNLPTEKVTKRDIFHRFYKHGKLAQISIKQAYGFVQFLDAESCRRALDAEQGQTVRGRKMRK